MQMGTIISDKPLEAARERVCLKYGHISCIGGCIYFTGATDEGEIICAHEKKCNPEMLHKKRIGRYFTPTPKGLATVIPGAVLINLAKAARRKPEVYTSA